MISEKAGVSSPKGLRLDEQSSGSSSKGCGAEGVFLLETIDRGLSILLENLWGDMREVGLEKPSLVSPDGNEICSGMTAGSVFFCGDSNATSMLL